MAIAQTAPIANERMIPIARWQSLLTLQHSHNLEEIVKVEASLLRLLKTLFASFRYDNVEHQRPRSFLRSSTVA